MAGKYTRGAVDAIIRNTELTEEQKTEKLFALYGQALDEGYISKSAAEDAKAAAIEEARKGWKADPVDPKTTPEYMELAHERDMLRAIGGDDFATVKPKFREQVWNMLNHGEGAKSVQDQLSGIREKYDEYFVEQGPKPQFGSPDKGTMPSGEKGGAATIFDAWGFGPKQQ